MESWFKYANRSSIWSITLVDHVYTDMYVHTYLDTTNHPCYILRGAQSTTEKIESNYSQLNSKRLLSLFSASIRAFHVIHAWNGARAEERKIDTRRARSVCRSWKYSSLSNAGNRLCGKRGWSSVDRAVDRAR